MAPSFELPCINHANRQAVARCRTCGKRVCELCVMVQQTRTYCLKCANSGEMTMALTPEQRASLQTRERRFPAATAKTAAEPETLDENAAIKDLTPEELEAARRSGAGKEELLALAGRSYRRRKAYLKIAFWRTVPKVLGTIALVVFVLPVIIMLGMVIGLSVASDHFLEAENRGHKWAADIVFFNSRMDYELTRYESARYLYERAIESFPQHPKVPYAHYMVALCYEKQRDLAMSRQWLHKIVEQYPDTGIARTAQNRLNFKHW